jgi:hypothetical protein
MSGHDDTDGARKTIRAKDGVPGNGRRSEEFVTIEEGVAEMNEAGIGG